MKTYHYLLLFALVFCWNSMKAQPDTIPPSKGGTTTTSRQAQKTAISNSPIENNVRNTLIIIQQNYQLKDVTLKKNNLFGRGGNKHFGTVYTIGVKTEDGYYTNDRAILPWFYDSNYDEYISNMQYEPVISATNYRPLAIQKFQSFSFKADPANLTEEGIFFISKKLSAPTLQVDSKTGDQKGWIVWVVQDDKSNEPDAFALSTQAMDLNFDETKTAAFVGSVPQNAICGFFVTQQEINKQILTVLSGFVIEGDGFWYVKKPPVVTTLTKTKEKKANSNSNVDPNALTRTSK